MNEYIITVQHINSSKHLHIIHSIKRFLSFLYHLRILSYTTFLYHLLILPSYTTFLYYLLIPPSYTTFLYYLLIPPSYTTFEYCLIPPSYTTFLYHPLIPPSNVHSFFVPFYNSHLYYAILLPIRSPQT